MNNNNVVGSVFVFLAALLWSLAGLILKTAVASTTWFILIRAVIAGLLFLPFIIKYKVRLTKQFVFTGILYYVFLATFNTTTLMSSSTLAVAMQSAAPVYVIFMTAFSLRRFSLRKLPTVILIMSGIAMSIYDVRNTAAPIALLCGIATGFCFIAYSGQLKKIETSSPMGTIGLINLVAAVFSLCVLPFDFKPLPTDFLTWGALLISGIFVSGISYTLYGSGLKKIPVEKAMLIALAEPILNPVWVFLGTGEAPSLLVGLGLVIILVGVVTDIFIEVRFAKIKG
jgi:drug/metabolite transporter (DMT)-like permease